MLTPSFSPQDHVVASSASHPGVPLPAPSPTEARLRLGDLTKLLYLIARVQDEAAEQGVPYEQVAPRPRWIPHNIANVKMLVKRFGDQHATNQLNRLVLSQAKKALKKLQKMKRVGGPQQQQAEGGGTGGVEGGNSAGGSEGTGNDDGGGT